MGLGPTLTNSPFKHSWPRNREKENSAQNGDKDGKKILSFSFFFSSALVIGLGSRRRYREGPSDFEFSTGRGLLLYGAEVAGEVVVGLARVTGDVHDRPLQQVHRRR